MRPPNHLDSRRLLKPRDYLADPYKFGVEATAQPQVPVGGDLISAKIALVQHRLVLRYRAAGSRPSGQQIAELLGCSRSVISDSMNGHRWMGEAVMAVLLAEMSRPSR